MTKKYVFLAFWLSVAAFAQDGPFGGEYEFNPDHVECLSPAKRDEIKAQLATSRQVLVAQGKLPAQNLGAHVMFDWPVVKNPTANYNNVWSISNYVDHNAAFPNQVQDWNCGSRTYDTSGGYNHQGVDIFTWPFTWYQMANNQSWAVAAASGVILYKSNGNPDTSCAMGGGNWNAVYVAHSDGTTTWYGHLKNNSLTTKAVGEFVAAGEFLGVIGSSGNSTGPHLHFEVYDTADALVDTYSGTCNNWNGGDSWWNQQKPYIEPKVNAAFTHSAAPIFPNCPQIETPNFKNEFLVGQNVVCAGYFADQNIGAQATISLYRPNGTLAYTSFAITSELYYASWWFWTFNPSTLNQTGIWTVTFSLGGSSLSHQFAYGTTLATNDLQKNAAISFYPNPANDQITFSKTVDEVEAISVDGKSIPLTIQGESAQISHLPCGVYILRGKSENKDFRLKLVKS
ncbi:peptidoglycan DD-metalloendopeptidase family protein [Flavobacterium sp.]|uniref:peptidoglycan DD-metalloendopeptidase family protein n=1 Tax=Flavobacterium sp. TaxID=239 RepID=UPI00122939B7|nr:peptidoglycan DD-metalloendopeptidase family protein [Flavobacterium sp.]RZJ69528.1 MAG: T9SS type A sorting domain-containing protein [Flavobacterium sp.]